MMHMSHARQRHMIKIIPFAWQSRVGHVIRRHCMAACIGLLPLSHGSGAGDKTSSLPAMLASSYDVSPYHLNQALRIENQWSSTASQIARLRPPTAVDTGRKISHRRVRIEHQCGYNSRNPNSFFETLVVNGRHVAALPVVVSTRTKRGCTGFLCRKLVPLTNPLCRHKP